jgi:hypothetical protein
LNPHSACFGGRPPNRWLIPMKLETARQGLCPGGGAFASRESSRSTLAPSRPRAASAASRRPWAGSARQCCGTRTSLPGVSFDRMFVSHGTERHAFGASTFSGPFTARSPRLPTERPDRWPENGRTCATLPAAPESLARGGTRQRAAGRGCRGTPARRIPHRGSLRECSRRTGTDRQGRRHEWRNAAGRSWR